MTEQELLEMLTDSSQRERAFQLLVQTYGERLYQHLYHLLHQAQDAEDVLQNVFVKVYRGIGGFKGEARLYTWLYRIATNEALSFLERKRRKRGWLSSLNSPAMTPYDPPATEDGPDSETINAKLESALAQLPPKQRAVFCLRYYEERSYQEISEMLGTSVGALKASYHHAVRKIEASLRA
ncbi:MAG: RNA polymerase sigma factor [Bacteroidetes bacterium]|nr:MAG: RNA polymerase sigma factor [Bacteroidota bacterium]